jgi:predicted phosphodiesterase
MLKETGITKCLVFGDVHAPSEDENVLRAIEKYGEFYSPDIIIALGDIGDFESVSHWLKNKSRLVEGKRLGKDIKSAVSVLKRMGNINSKAHKIVTLGNHEDWVEKYLDEHAELDGMFSVKEEYTRAGWEVVDFNIPYQIGKLYFIHGLYTNIYHAAKTVHSLSASVMYGHTHDFQAHGVSFLDGEKSGMRIGCCCDMNPHYLRQKPKKWVHGFATVDFFPNGNFTPDFIRIIDGQFSRQGVIFDGKTK